MLCTSKHATRKGNQPCTRRNITYKGTCSKCKESQQTTEYIGESGADMYDRGRKHLQLWKACHPDSWMMCHYVDKHADTQKDMTTYTFEVIKYHRSALERQVEEACLKKWLKADPKVENLNSKCEYNRCIIPKLGSVGNMGDPQPKNLKRMQQIRSGNGCLNTQYK